MQLKLMTKIVKIIIWLVNNLVIMSENSQKLYFKKF